MGEYDNLLNDFLAESREHLNSIEPDLLEMERSGATTSKESLNRVFRAIHSIKGASGFFAFESLKRLSHAMENVLMPIRDGALAVTPEITDALLNGVDTLRAMLDDIQASEQVPCQELVDLLNGLLKKPTKDAATAAPKDVTSLSLDARYDPNSPAIRDAISKGMHLYRVRVNLLRDMTQKNRSSEALSELVLSMGQVIAFPADAQALSERLREDVSFSFIMTCVLTAQLLAEGLDMPNEQIEPIDTESIRKEVLAERQSKPGAAAASAHDPVETAASTSSIPATGAPVAGTAVLPSQPEAQAVLPPAASAVAQAGLAAPSATAAGIKHEGPESIRVRVDHLARVMNSASELVLSRNQLLSMLDRHVREIPGLLPVLQHLDRTVSELQERAMQTRMQPIDSLFVKFTRMVRDLARQMTKTIDLSTEGAEVELDKSVIERLGDPLTHLIRNCVDHAIETPQERQAAGKNPKGHILLRAYQQGGQVNIEVRDDGRGIDLKRVQDKAIEKGLITVSQAQSMSPKEITNLIFLPGFSTAAKVTEVSGRGVGLDVVRTNVEKLGGQVEIETTPGKGSAFLLRLPLTLAIIPALTIGVAGQKFAVPQMNLVELVRIRVEEAKNRIERVNHRPVLRLRGQLLPLVRLARVLGLAPSYVDSLGAIHTDRRQAIGDRRHGSGIKAGQTPATPTATPAPAASADVAKSERKNDRRRNPHGDYRVLVVQVGANRFGIIVDELFDSGEVVVKPLSVYANSSGCFAGSTITGDGRVILILDVGGIASRSRLESAQKDRAAEQSSAEVAAAANRQSIILFNHGSEELLAVGQERLLRLERTRPEQIERIGDREFIQYQGAAMPVVRLDHHLPVHALPSDARELYLLIPKRPGRRPAGILASRIVDALDVNVTVQPSDIAVPGVQGTAIVGSKLALFIDPEQLLDAVFLEKSA